MFATIERSSLNAPVGDWENTFAERLRQTLPSVRGKSGALLSLIPCRAQWEEFLADMRAQWRYENGYYSVRRERPHCFTVLIGGVAFYQYDENRFWPQFAQATAGGHISSQLQHEISADFARVARQLGLKILQREAGTDYVGSAIYHIGVPLSLWSGFLELCEWALWNDQWDDLSDAEWEAVCAKRALGRTRLRNFLVSHRAAAREFIKEMHDARRILADDETLSINDLKQASLLRREYFDEVPETAEFLRPSNPESLCKDRARLVWEANEDRSRVSLHLPAVARNQLPATWVVGSLMQPAAATADTLPLNSAAFSDPLLVQLKSAGQSETQRLRGIASFGLFDCERNKFVDTARETLPIGNYTLISSTPLPDLSRRGFDDQEHQANEPYELEDGKACYITQLYPTGKSAAVSFSQAGKTRKIAFRSGLKVEARIFAGAGSAAVSFNRYQEWIKVERLPLLCLAIPFGSFEKTEAVLHHKFQVCVGEQITEGCWEKRHEDEHQEFYIWRWLNHPQPHKKVSVAIKAPTLGIGFDYQIEMLQPKPGLAGCWQNLPGAFLPLCLLAQPVAGMKEGMRWQDLLLAREAIAPYDRASDHHLRYRLREYVNCGLLAQQHHSWVIAESRAVITSRNESEFRLSYCGNPALLWAMFRHLHSQFPDSLPIVEVVNPRGELPFLQMAWRAAQRAAVLKYLQNRHVRIVSNLWRP